MDRLLQSLNPINKDIDEPRMIEAEKRVVEIENGKIKTVSGEYVFQRLHDRHLGCVPFLHAPFG